MFTNFNNIHIDLFADHVIGDIEHIINSSVILNIQNYDIAAKKISPEPRGQFFANKNLRKNITNLAKFMDKIRELSYSESKIMQILTELNEIRNLTNV